MDGFEQSHGAICISDSSENSRKEDANSFTASYIHADTVWRKRDNSKLFYLKYFKKNEQTLNLKKNRQTLILSVEAAER